MGVVTGKVRDSFAPPTPWWDRYLQHQLVDGLRLWGFLPPLAAAPGRPTEDDLAWGKGCTPWDEVEWPVAKPAERTWKTLDRWTYTLSFDPLPMRGSFPEIQNTIDQANQARVLEAELDLVRQALTAEKAAHNVTWHERCALSDEVVKARDEAKANHHGACRTAAGVAAAAVGEACGSGRGVVEDMADLRAERDAARADARCLQGCLDRVGVEVFEDHAELHVPQPDGGTRVTPLDAHLVPRTKHADVCRKLDQAREVGAWLRDMKHEQEANPDLDRLKAEAATLQRQLAASQRHEELLREAVAIHRHEAMVQAQKADAATRSKAPGPVTTPARVRRLTEATRQMMSERNAARARAAASNERATTLCLRLASARAAMNVGDYDQARRVLGAG